MHYMKTQTDNTKLIGRLNGVRPVLIVSEHVKGSETIDFKSAWLEDKIRGSHLLLEPNIAVIDAIRSPAGLGGSCIFD